MAASYNYLQLMYTNFGRFCRFSSKSSDSCRKQLMQALLKFQDQDDVARNQSKCEKRDFCSQTKPTVDYPTISGYTNKFMNFLEKLDEEMAPIKSGIRDLQHQVMELGIPQLGNLNMVDNFTKMNSYINNANALQCSFDTNHSLPTSTGSTHTSHSLPHSNGGAQYVGKVVTRKVKDPSTVKRTDMSSSCLSSFTSSSQRSYQSNSKCLEQGTSLRLVSKPTPHQSKPAIEIYIVASPDAFPKLSTIRHAPSYCHKY